MYTIENYFNFSKINNQISNSNDRIQGNFKITNSPHVRRLQKSESSCTSSPENSTKQFIKDLNFIS